MSQQNIGSCIILLDSKREKILLGRRRNIYGAGFWGLPGGRVKLNEPIRDSIKRELLEEANLELLKVKYLGVVREFQETYDFIHFGFFAEKYAGKLKNMELDKNEEWKWFDLNNLPRNILRGHYEIIKMFKYIKINLKDLTEGING